jgi:hypothetical protein
MCSISEKRLTDTYNAFNEAALKHEVGDIVEDEISDVIYY